MMPKRATRPQRKGAAEAKDKPAEENKELLGKADEEKADPKADARGGAEGGKAGAADKRPAPAKKPDPAPKPISGAKANDKDKMDEVSEERSGDQPAHDDDATAAPVPERVRSRARDRPRPA